MAEKTPLPPPLKMLVTHYYSVKTENGIPQRDTMMACFSCHQAVVYDDQGKESELRFYYSDMERIKTGKASDVKSGQILYGYQHSYDAAGNQCKTGSIGCNRLDCELALCHTPGNFPLLVQHLLSKFKCYKAGHIWPFTNY